MILETGISRHNERVRFLDALTILIGCRESIGPVLPDGRRPDVMRLNSKRRVLFLGEAKDTESAGIVATQARLQRYLLWLSAHVAAGGVGVFAICTGSSEDGESWREVIGTLSREASLGQCESGRSLFPGRTVVLWFVFDKVAAFDEVVGALRHSGRGWAPRDTIGASRVRRSRR